MLRCRMEPKKQQRLKRKVKIGVKTGEKWAKKRTVKLTLWSRNLAADLGLLGVSAQI